MIIGAAKPAAAIPALFRNPRREVTAFVCWGEQFAFMAGILSSSVSEPIATPFVWPERIYKFSGLAQPDSNPPATSFDALG
jgi:hypothetical protein